MFSELETFICNFLISGSAAIVSKTIIAPVERAKLILQSQASAYQIITGQREQYKGLNDIFRRVPQEQGILSLWRGNGVNLLRYFPMQALSFAFYDTFQHNINKYIIRDTYAKVVVYKFMAGALAGTCSTVLVFPLIFCQTRLSLDIGSSSGDKAAKCNVPREFDGLNHCLTAVVKRDGARGLYRGILVSLMGVSLYRAFYFGVFDISKQLYYKNPLASNNYQKPPLPVLFFLAQLVTSMSGFIAYPLDTVSRYMMLDSGRPERMRNSKTIYMTCKHIYRNHGFIGFYMGGLTNVLRCTAGALVLVLYDEFLYYTNWKEKLKKANENRNSKRNN